MKSSAPKIHKLSKVPTAPEHLGDDGKAHWNAVLASFTFDEHDLPLLASACEQLDRAHAARLVIAVEGVTIKDRFGVLKENPAVAVERNAHLAFCRLERELALQLPPADSRSPLSRNYR